MEKLSVKDLFNKGTEYLGKTVLMQGWVRTNRAQKEFGFLNVNDGSFLENVQVVYESSLSNFEDVQKFRVGSGVSVEGIVVKSPNVKQPYELKASKVILEADSPEDYPIQPKRHTREFLREKAYLRMRTNLFSAVFRMRSKLAFAIHKYFQEKNFI